MFVIMVCICCYGLCLLLWSVFFAMVYVCYYGQYLLLWFMFLIMVCICCYGLCLHNNTIPRQTEMNGHNNTTPRQTEMIIPPLDKQK
jgi:hypothetical protein